MSTPLADGASPASRRLRIAAATSAVLVVIVTSAILLMPVRRTVATDALSVRDGTLAASAVVVSCRFPTADPPHGSYKDATGFRCDSVTSGRLFYAGVVLVVGSAAVLVLLVLARRAVRRATTAALPRDPTRALGVVARLALGTGVIALAYGAADQGLVARNERDLSVDRVALLQAPKGLTTASAFELLSRPVLGGSAPWRHELFIVFTVPPSDSSVILADVEPGVVTWSQQFGWQLDPVASQYTNGWVTSRGTAGADLAEVGPCKDYLTTDSADPDAVALLGRTDDCAQPSTVLVHVYANPLPGH